MIGWPIFQFLSYPIAFLFPGYNSFKAVITKDGKDDTRWLCYWMSYSIIYFIETLFSLIVASFPFYYELKCAFLIYLQWDTARLAEKLYQKYLRSTLKKWEPSIDDFINKYSQQAVEMHKTVRNKVAAVAAEQMISGN